MQGSPPTHHAHRVIPRTWRSGKGRARGTEDKRGISAASVGNGNDYKGVQENFGGG